MKKAIIGFVIFCLVFIVGLLFSYLSKGNSENNMNILSAVPINSGIVIKSNSYSDLMDVVVQNSEMWQELINIPSVAIVNNNVFTIDSLTHRLLDDGDVLLDNEFCVSLINTRDDIFDFLFVVSLENDRELQYGQEFVRKAIPDSAIVEKRDYNGVVLSLVKTSGREISYCFTNGLFICSYSAILVESAVRQLNSENSLLTDKEFLKVQKTAGSNVDCNVYVNYKAIPQLVSCFLDEKSSSAVLHSPFLGSWGEWDTDVKNNGVLLNGFSSFSADKGDYFSLFRNQTSIRTEITEILPANTSVFISVGLSDVDQFKSDYSQYLLSCEDGAETLARISQLNKSFDTNVPQVFVDVLGEEMAMAFTDINTVDVYENSFAVFQVKSNKIAEDALQGLIASYSAYHKVSPNTFSRTVKIDSETEFSAYKMPVGNVPEIIFGSLFKHARSEYVCFLDNYMVFANSLRSLEKFINSHVLGTDLDHDSSFGDFVDHLGNSYNLMVYAHVERGSSLYHHLLSGDLQKDYSANISTFSKYQAIGAQFSSSQNMMYSNLFLYYNPEEDERPRTVWESRLDSSIQFKPKLVETHVSSGKIIFVQDLANNVYMVNKAGRVLWKQPVKEPIESQIHHVDFYKNGKIQYAFSTKNYIYIIDRIGNFVEDYPLRLKSPATAGMSVFNYDGKKDYRFAIPCEDKKVYVYTKEGRTLPGWAFEGTDSPVLNPVEHFSVDGKDYIVFADRYNTHVLNRRGDERLKLDAKYEKAQNSPFYFENSNGFTPERFVTTAIDGSVVSISLDGKVELKSLGTFSDQHFFELFDVDGDGKKDYVFLDGNRLDVFRFDGNKMYSYVFDKPILQRPVMYLFSKTDVKIGVVDTESHRIYLVNNDGELYKGFPLRGNTLFSIGVFGGGQGKFNLLVGSDENFLYNYRVN